jgi:hypothetical protein
LLTTQIGGQVYYNPNTNPNQFTKELINTGSYKYSASSGLTYSITVKAVNVIGSSSSTITVTT